MKKKRRFAMCKKNGLIYEYTETQERFLLSADGVWSGWQSRYVVDLAPYPLSELTVQTFEGVGYRLFLS